MYIRILFFILCVQCELFSFAQSSISKPNIVLILADDMGFSDIGCFGSEIHTPHLDQLAKEGLKMTQFYNTGRCCPSRASLLTGLYAHQAGIGDMIKDKGSSAYQGYLNDHCATIAELLKDKAGYTTIVSGKWHVGLVSSALAFNRGFDKSFTMLNNGSSYFNSNPLYNDGSKITFLLNNNEITRTDTSAYLTQAITNFALQSLEEIKDQKKPFFLYLAYNAPHWPIQALPEDIALYKKMYLPGWEQVRRRRYEKMMATGIIKKNWLLSNPYSTVPDWEKLSAEEKNNWDTRMAIYAAMIYRMDKCIGEIMTKLRELGKGENTIVFFISDNGGSADEVKSLSTVLQKSGVPGSVESIDSYERPWANVSNTPFKLFKRNMHEGGISTPFIAWYPGVIKAGSVNTQPAHLIDIMPTCLQLAGIDYPQTFKNRNLTPLAGVSLINALNDQSFQGHDTLYWEHEGSRAVRIKQWKLVAEVNQPWELYDLDADRSETQNLALLFPDRVRSMEKEYLKWALKVGVEDWNKIKDR